jgi:hypothetical protein
MNAPLLPRRVHVEDCGAVLDAGIVLRSIAEAEPEDWRHYCETGDARQFAPVRQAFRDGGNVTLAVALGWRQGVARIAWRRPAGAGAQVLELSAGLFRIGGLRWWWRCPASGRPCARLYLPEGERFFAGREAHRLAYRSEVEGEPERARRRAVRLRQALGETPAAVGGAVPLRPLRMRAEVYARAVEEIRSAEALLLRR